MKYYLLILIILLAGCIEVEIPIIVEDGDILPDEICDNLDKVIVIHKLGCPDCSVAIPRLEEIEEELGVEFVYYDVAIDKQRTELLSLGFVPRLVSTIVVDCKVYTGAMTKEEYKEIIEEWLVD